MAKTKISFSAWTSSGEPTWLPKYAMADEWVSDIDAVCKAIERKSRMDVISCRDDGSAVSQGKATANHYELTLGDHVSGGGYTPRMRLWVSIPV